MWLQDELFIILYNILKLLSYIDVKLLNNKYICTIYTLLKICITSIHRFALRDKVTLWQLELYLFTADVAQLSRVLDIKLSDWCCSASMLWVRFQLSYHKNQKSNIIILLSLNLRHINIFPINLVFQVTLKYGDILYENVTQQCYNYICVRVLIPLFKPGIHFCSIGLRKNRPTNTFTNLIPIKSICSKLSQSNIIYIPCTLYAYDLTPNTYAIFSQALLRPLVHLNR